MFINRSLANDALKIGIYEEIKEFHKDIDYESSTASYAKMLGVR